MIADYSMEAPPVTTVHILEGAGDEWHTRVRSSFDTCREVAAITAVLGPLTLETLYPNGGSHTNRIQLQEGQTAIWIEGMDLDIKIDSTGPSNTKWHPIYLITRTLNHKASLQYQEWKASIKTGAGTRPHSAIMRETTHSPGHRMLSCRGARKATALSDGLAGSLLEDLGRFQQQDKGDRPTPRMPERRGTEDTIQIHQVNKMSPALVCRIATAMLGIHRVDCEQCTNIGPPMEASNFQALLHDPHAANTIRKGIALEIDNQYVVPYEIDAKTKSIRVRDTRTLAEAEVDAGTQRLLRDWTAEGWRTTW
eukprot:gene12171-3903_t